MEEFLGTVVKGNVEAKLYLAEQSLTWLCFLMTASFVRLSTQCAL